MNRTNLTNWLRALSPARCRDEYGRLLRLGAPVLVTQLGIIVVSFADTIMVGAYGTSELAAAAFVNSLFLVTFVMMFGFAGGLTPLVGALYGKGDSDGCGRTLRAATQLNALLSLGFTAVMGGVYFFIPYMGQDPDLLPLIRTYYLIILGGLVPTAIFNCFQQMANGTTDTAMPMWLILGANLLNILGNYILIFGHFGAPEMGLTGAGISTVVSRTLATVAILLIMLRSRRYRPYQTGLRGTASVGGIRRKVWLTSYPVMLQSGAECLLWSFGAVVCGWFGKIELAAYQIVNTAGQLGFMTYLSFGVALSIRVANLLGAGDMPAIRRAITAGLHLNFLLGTLASAVFLIWFSPLMHIFTPDDAVVANAHALLLPLILYQYCDAAQITFANAQRGTSRVKPLLWAALAAYVAVGIPAALLFAVSLGMENVGVYYSFCAALLCAALILGFFLRRTLRTL